MLLLLLPCAGSLLVGKTSQECVALKQKVNELTEGGLRAEYLSSGDLFLKEPAILVDDETGAAFLPDDSQLDAHRTVAYIEKVSWFPWIIEPDSYSLFFTYFVFELFRVTESLQQKDDMQSSIMNQLQA